jgi:hypothetical protein
MKTYTLTPESQEAFDNWLDLPDNTAYVPYDGIGNCLEAFFQDHPEHLTEQPSTSKRDEVLMVATAIYCDPLRQSSVADAVELSVELIAEVDKRFNTKEG